MISLLSLYFTKALQRWQINFTELLYNKAIFRKGRLHALSDCRWSRRKRSKLFPGRTGKRFFFSGLRQNGGKEASVPGSDAGADLPGTLCVSDAFSYGSYGCAALAVREWLFWRGNSQPPDIQSVKGKTTAANYVREFLPSRY